MFSIKIDFIISIWSYSFYFNNTSNYTVYTAIFFFKHLFRKFSS